MSSNAFSLTDIDAAGSLLAGEVAVVTGAGRGNGAAIARGLARAGARVCVADIDGDSARATAEAIDPRGERAVAVTWNIADPAQGRAAVEAIHRFAPRVSVLVNNAGIEAGGRMGEAGFSRMGEAGFSDAWRRVMDVNLDGTMHAVEALLPDLRASRGSIVNVASIQSFIAYQAGTSAYAASKGALAQLTRSLAVELAADGIRVNAVAPGFFETAMTAGTRADPGRMAGFLSRTPLRRMGQPKELAGPVIFLASRLSTYVTGAILPVDGGLLAQ